MMYILIFNLKCFIIVCTSDRKMKVDESNLWKWGMNKKRQIIVKVKRASMKGMYRGGGLLLSKRLVVLIKEIEPSFATHL